MEKVKLTFYILKIQDNGSTIRVPVQNADRIGMRTVMDAEKVDRIYEILRDRESPTDTQTWNRLYREYMSKIKTGDPLEVAKVLRDLALMKIEKNLSFGERKMYDQARSLLVQEISTARDVDEKLVEGEIEAIFLPADASTTAEGVADRRPEKGAVPVLGVRFGRRRVAAREIETLDARGIPPCPPEDVRDSIGVGVADLDDDDDDNAAAASS